MAVHALGLNKSDFERSFLIIPNLHHILAKTQEKLLSFLSSPITKNESGFTLFECVKIQKDGSSKTQYDFLDNNQRAFFEGKYDKGFYFNQVKLFEAMFDSRNALAQELIEHALFLVFNENPVYLNPIKSTQLLKVYTVMKNLFFTEKTEFNPHELEFASYHIDRNTFEKLKKNTICEYLSVFTNATFTEMFTYAYGIKNTDILAEQVQAYEKYKNHIPELYKLYKESPNKVYWILRNKLLPTVLSIEGFFDTPYIQNDEGLSFFNDERTYCAFLNCPTNVLDQISVYPKAQESEITTRGKKWLFEQIFSSFQIFNLQTHFLAYSKYKENINPQIFRICFHTKAFIVKKLHETRCLTVDKDLALRAIELIYDELLTYSEETIRQINMVLNNEKPKKPDASAFEFVDKIRLLERFISDNQVFKGQPSLVSNLNLIKSIYSFSDFLQISQEWEESIQNNKQLLELKNNLQYEEIDFSDFSEHMKLFDSDFYQRPKCKELGMDQSNPERLNSFVFGCRLSMQYVIFYVKVNHIFDQYVLDIAKTPTGSAVRNEESNMSNELVIYLNRTQKKIALKSKILSTI